MEAADLKEMEFDILDVSFALRDAGNLGLGYMAQEKWKPAFRRVVGYTTDLKNTTYTWEDVEGLISELDKDITLTQMEEAMINRIETKRKVEAEYQRRKAAGEMESIRLTEVK